MKYIIIDHGTKDPDDVIRFEIVPERIISGKNAAAIFDVAGWKILPDKFDSEEEAQVEVDKLTTFLILWNRKVLDDVRV